MIEAWVLGRLGDRTGERTQLRAAVALDPNYPRAHHSLGVVLLAEGAPEALGLLARAAALAPLDPQFRHSHAEALARGGRPAEARQEWAEALRLAPAHLESHTGLGRLARAEGEDRLALEHFTRAFELDPSATIPRNNLAWLRATSNDPQVRDAEAAWAVAEPLLRSDPTDPAILDTVAAALAINGRFAEAARTARRAAEFADSQAPELAAEIRRRAAEFEARAAPVPDE